MESDGRQHRPCLGFPGYTVADDGVTVTSYRRKTPHVLKTYPLRRGYVVVTLRRDGKAVRKRMHHLVLEAFVGPRPPGMVGCHYPDTSPSNNAISNLRWDTPTENEKDKWRDKLLRTEKTCTRCGETLAKEDHFYAEARSHDGYRGKCKSCHNRVCIATRTRDNHRRLNREAAARRKTRAIVLEVA